LGTGHVESPLVYTAVMPSGIETAGQPVDDRLDPAI
jgi:hypothetical protein